VSDLCKCKPLQVKVVDQSTGGPFTSWTLDFGDGQSIITPKSSGIYYHTYKAAGNYLVTLTVDNGGGQVSTQHKVTVPRPCADFTFSVLPGCGNTKVQFTDTSKGFKTGMSYSWAFGYNGATSTDQNPSYTYPAGGGTYQVTLKITAWDGTTSSITKAVTIPPPAYAAFSVTRTCGSKTVTFTSTSCGVTPGMKYNWVFGDGKTYSTTSSASFTHSYQNKGTYKVTLTITTSNGGATNIPSVTRLVSVPPPCSGFMSGTTCNSWMGKFTDGSSGDLGKWHWDFGDGGSSDQQNPSHTFGSDDTFTVTLQVTANDGSTDQCMHKVTVRPLCAGFTTSTTCGSLVVALTDMSTPQSAISSWLWSFGDKSTQTITPPAPGSTTHPYAKGGTYGITLKVTGKDGSSVTTPSTQVKVCSALSPSISSVTISTGRKVTFKGSSTGSPSAWSWDFGDKTTGSGQSVTHTYSKAGTYNVVLSVKDACGCSYPTPARAVTV
jgi:PKD repeat protein